MFYVDAADIRIKNRTCFLVDGQDDRAGRSRNQVPWEYRALQKHQDDNEASVSSYMPLPTLLCSHPVVLEFVDTVS